MPPGGSSAAMIVDRLDDVMTTVLVSRRDDVAIVALHVVRRI
ncbi:MAG: hypothetical protein ACYCZM_03485 [Acidimicrobiales bacterium]